MNRRAATLGCLIFLGLASLTSGLSARDAFDLSLSPDNPVVEHRYEGFVVAAPTSSGDGTYTPNICKQAEHCDTIDVNAFAPPKYGYRWGMKVTLTWPFLTEAHAEDLDMWLFDAADTNLSGGQAATGDNPEEMIVSNLDPDKYLIVVLNFSGVEEYYDLKVEFVQGSPTGRRQSPSPTPTLNTTKPTPADAPSTQGPPPETQAPAQSPPPVIDAGSGTKPPPPSQGEGSSRVLSAIPWDGGRLTLGLLILAGLAFASYTLLFAKQRSKISASRSEDSPAPGP